MSKYLHIDEDTGKVTVKDGQTTGWRGWIYQVPNNYVMYKGLDDIEGRTTISELLEDDEQAILVRTSN